MTKQKYDQRAGLYKIVSKTTGQFYIGSTISFNERWKCHTSCLRNKTHCNYKLTKLVSDYGLEDLVFEELSVYSGSDRSELYALEQKAIDKYKPTLNIAFLVQPGTGIEVIKVLQYDISGKFVARYDSVREASIEVGVALPSIYKHLKDNEWIVASSMWRIQETEDYPLEIEPFNFKTEEGGSGNWRRFWHQSEYTIYQWNLEGDLVKTWSNKKDIVEYLGCYSRSLDDHIHGQRGSLNGFIFTTTLEFPGYVNRQGEYNSSKVRLTPEGNLITTGILEFRSYSEAGRHFGVKPSTIGQASKKYGYWRGYSITEKAPGKKYPEITLTPSLGEVLEFPSINEAGRHFGVSESGISRALNNGVGTWRNFAVETVSD